MGAGKWAEGLATEEEALAYVSTASLAAPLSHAMSNIYFYLFRRYCQGKQIEFPGDPELGAELNGMETQLLTEMRRWIRRQQVKAWRAKERRKEVTREPIAVQGTLGGFEEALEKGEAHV